MLVFEGQRSPYDAAAEAPALLLLEHIGEDGILRRRFAPGEHVAFERDGHDIAVTWTTDQSASELFSSLTGPDHPAMARAVLFLGGERTFRADEIASGLRECERKLHWVRVGWEDNPYYFVFVPRGFGGVPELGIHGPAAVGHDQIAWIIETMTQTGTPQIRRHAPSVSRLLP